MTSSAVQSRKAVSAYFISKHIQPFGLHSIVLCLMGLVELKSPKIREKLGLAGHHPPTPLSIFLKHIQKTKTHTTNTHSIFFNLTRPLSGAAALVLHWVNVWLLRSRTALLHNHGYPGVHHRGLGTARSTLAVSSSPRSWIHEFALPEKFNMAVTENDLDPKVLKMSITFY